jgi:hypothetical protein
LIVPKLIGDPVATFPGDGPHDDTSLEAPPPPDPADDDAADDDDDDPAPDALDDPPPLELFELPPHPAKANTRPAIAKHVIHVPRRK